MSPSQVPHTKIKIKLNTARSTLMQIRRMLIGHRYRRIIRMIFNLVGSGKFFSSSKSNWAHSKVWLKLTGPQRGTVINLSLSAPPPDRCDDDSEPLPRTDKFTRGAPRSAISALPDLLHKLQRDLVTKSARSRSGDFQNPGHKQVQGMSAHLRVSDMVEQCWHV